ncbi:iron/zinc transporter protein-like protein [Novymonas esmeraldas]|uniref:Iron/zinc transporter protein-like protein n=1 Tax=Novymonas esmeraldas TaxID=1808958 RepID=A0AAW0EZ13_9TRYP
MSPMEMSVEASMRLLTELGYRVTVPLQNTGIAAVEVEEGERSLCEGFTGSYSLGLHIGALFLILGVSFLGTAIPILGKCIPWLVKYPFVFSVAKSAATGVLLSVSTIHLIFEGAEGFTEPCVPQLLKNYAPLYFLLALIAVLLMQALDMQLADIAERWMKAKMREDEEAAAGTAPENQPSDKYRELPAEVEVGPCGAGAKPDVTVAAVDEPERESDNAHELHRHRGEAVEHGHQHLSVAPPRDMGAIRRVISAVCMEFGVTLHSLFVGLTVGLTTDDELKPLLVALVFHQLFEGMAMGSRLADAEFKGSLDIVLALVFAFSAPLGMAAATIAVSVSPGAMSGGGFVSMIAVLDVFCGGILLYLAFTLLLGDFVADVKRYCGEDQKYRLLKKAILFAAVWIGMGLMALVGNWL